MPPDMFFSRVDLPPRLRVAEIDYVVDSASATRAIRHLCRHMLRFSHGVDDLHASYALMLLMPLYALCAICCRVALFRHFYMPRVDAFIFC